MKDSENDCAVYKHKENHESTCADDKLHMHFHVGGCKCENCNQDSQSDNTPIDGADFTLNSCDYSIKAFEDIHDCAVGAVRYFSCISLNLTFIEVELIFQFGVCYCLGSFDCMALALL